MADTRAIPVWLAAATLLSMVQSPVPSEAPPTVRFHHVHYQVGNPSAAINATAAALEAVRVIVPGLGVGVRTGAEYLLFDRLDPTEPTGDAHPPLRDGYGSAVTWLKAHGINADPPDAARLRVSTLSLQE
jgi:hypothetical protein